MYQSKSQNKLYWQTGMQEVARPYKCFVAHRNYIYSVNAIVLLLTVLWFCKNNSSDKGL